MLRQFISPCIRVSRLRMTTWLQKSSFSTTQQRSSQQTRTIRIPPLPVILIGTAFTCLGIGLYEYMTSDIQKYPPAIRQALRRAIYYENTGKDSALAVKYFSQALNLALASNDMDPNGAPLTGIMIQLGTLYMTLGNLNQAKETLSLAIRHLAKLEQSSTSLDDAIDGLDLDSFSPLDRLKIIGIAQKLGDICGALQQDDEAEKWYVWSVEYLLKSSSRPASAFGDSDQVIFDQEHMPPWLTQTDLGASMEALGAFYASRHKYSFAIHLYLRALNLIGVETCQASIIMNNLSEAYTALGHGEEAQKWAQKGLDIAQNPNAKKNDNESLCDESCCTLLFNMGMLMEHSGNKTQAMQYYGQARQFGKEHNLSPCLKEALQAMRRLDRKTT